MPIATRDVRLKLFPKFAYEVLCGAIDIPFSTLSSADPERLRVELYYADLEAEMAVTVSLERQGDFTRIRFDADYPRVGDRYSSPEAMDRCLRKYEVHLRAHHDAYLSGAPPPTPPIVGYAGAVRVALYILTPVLLVLLLVGAGLMIWSRL